MPSILICPACHGEVALPEGRVELVSCPHCEKELLVTAQRTDVPPQQVIMLAPVPAPTPSASPPAAAAVADYRKRVAEQAQRPSTLGQMVGILTGGVLGMVVGYWLLNYFGGPRYNFLNIPLPLVPHTQPAPAHSDPPAPEKPVPPAPASVVPEEPPQPSGSGHRIPPNS